MQPHVKDLFYRTPGTEQTGKGCPEGSGQPLILSFILFSGFLFCVFPSGTALPPPALSLPPHHPRFSGNSNTGFPYFQCKSYPRFHTSSNPNTGCRKQRASGYNPAFLRSPSDESPLSYVKAFPHLPGKCSLYSPAYKCPREYPACRFPLPVPFGRTPFPRHTSPGYGKTAFLPPSPSDIRIPSAHSPFHQLLQKMPVPSPCICPSVRQWGHL